MDILKLTSIRLSKASLSQAAELGKRLGYYQSSHIIRLAIWVGLKVLRPGVILDLTRMMGKEELEKAHYSLEDVLRAADYEL